MMQQTIWVRHDITPAEMVKQGQYDNLEEALIAIEGFRIDGGVAEEVEALVFALVRNTTEKEAIAELAREGANPGGPEHLLGFGAAGLDRRFMISTEEEAVMRFNLLALRQSVRNEAGEKSHLSLTRFCAGPLNVKRHLKLQASLAKYTTHWNVLGIPR